MSKIDWTKPVQTRSGFNARVLATDLLDDEYPVAAAVTFKTYEAIYRYTIEGRYCANKDGEESDSDLINVPQKHEIWINIYPANKGMVVHRSRKDADKLANNDRIACIRIEYEEGEGL